MTASEILRDINNIDISSLTTEEIELLEKELRRVVDSLFYTLTIRKICEHKHKVQ